MTVKKIKKMIMLQDIKNSTRKSGDFGEGIAKKWLEEEWEIIDVSSQDKSFFDQDELKKSGAKRPDFVSIFDDNDDNQKVILWDAKFHNVENNSFKLTVEEICKYRKLRELFSEKMECEVSDVHIIFMIFPKSDDGNQMYLAHLTEFKHGTETVLNGEPAKEIILKDVNCYDTSLIQREELEKLLS